MRFQYLDLQSFGCFTDYRVDFAPDRTFHLIYGPNEAGKSTFLRAITDVLFGIPERTGDAYLHSTRRLRIGAGLLHSDGRELAFVRRKGRTRTLLDPRDDKPLDEAVLVPFLAGLDRETFQLMFGLNHERLTEGGRRLLRSGGSVGESLFEAASGISGLRELFGELYEEARSLFKPAGKNPPINDLIASYRQARRRVAELSLAVRSWDELAKRYDKEKQAVADLIERKKRLDEKKTRLERVSRTLPLLSQRRKCEEDLDKHLAQLAGVPPLPETAREERLAAQERLEAAQKAKKRAEDKIKALEQKKASFQIPTGLLEQNDAISKLYENLSQYRQNTANLPRLQGEIAQRKESVNALLRELYPQASSWKDVEKLRPALKDLENARELARQYPDLMADLKSIEKQISDSKRAAAENQARKQQLGPVQDVGRLRAAIKRAQKNGNLEEKLRETRRRARQLQEQLDAELEKLSLWSGTAAELERLSLPMAETVEVFGQRIDKIKSGIELVERDIQQLKEEIRRINERLVQLKFQGDVPSQEDLARARQHRDRGWQLIRQAWLEGVSDVEAEREFSPDQPLAEAYEAAVVKADETADRMRLESQQVAQKAALLASLEKYEAKLKGLNQDKAELEAALALVDGQWQEIWQPCGITALSPKEMLSWLQRCDKIIGQIRELREAERSAADLEAEIAAYRAEIGGALADLGKTAAEDACLEDLISLGQEVCSAADTARGSLERLEEEAARLQEQLRAADEKKEQVEKQVAQWQGRWTEAMRRLALPDDTTPKVAEAFIDKLNQLFGEIDALKRSQITVQQMVQEINDFKTRTENLLEKVPLDLSHLTPDLAVAQLKRAGEKASKDLASLEGINQQIRELEDERKAAAEEIEAAGKELEQLMARAHCQTISELEQAEELSERVRGLKKEIEELNKRLLASGDGLSLEEIACEAEGVNPDTLPGEIEEIRRQLNELDEERSRLEQRFGATKKEYETKVDGSSTAAAEAAEEAEAILARLEPQVARYVRLRLAAALLRMGVERYREQNQSPVLRRAGEFFCRLTLGSFSGLTVDYDASDNPILLGVRSCGETVGVEGMSDGTQDQLYLSLRLASIEKYLKEMEPLPVVVDDILINFDDERSRETLRVLAGLSEHTQVIFFTHHKALVRLAEQAVPDTALAIYSLDRAAGTAPLASLAVSS